MMIKIVCFAMFLSFSTIGFAAQDQATPMQSLLDKGFQIASVDVGMAGTTIFLQKNAEAYICLPGKNLHFSCVAIH